MAGRGSDHRDEFSQVRRESNDGESGMSDMEPIDTLDEQARNYMADKYGDAHANWDVLMARQNADGTEFEVVLKLIEKDMLEETVSGIGASLGDACDKAVDQT
jgi:hypothetical protein